MTTRQNVNIEQLEEFRTFLTENPDKGQLTLEAKAIYEGQAGLIFWLPSGRNRISMKGASEQYFWKHRGAGDDGIPIGRLLFSGLLVRQGKG